MWTLYKIFDNISFECKKIKIALSYVVFDAFDSFEYIRKKLNFHHQKYLIAILK